jgi:perosamine synthetase
MKEISKIAQRHGIVVIEDAAEAHGARLHGNPVGSFGDSAIFSFFGNKIITSGEGGIVVTDDEALAARLRVLRGHGEQPGRRFWYSEPGFNFRMSNLAAAVGAAQLRRFDEISAGFHQVGSWYRSMLGHRADIEILDAVVDAEAADWLFTIFLDAGRTTRDQLAASLALRCIETRPVFNPLHRMPPFLDKGGCFPLTERRSDSGISLPTSSLMTHADVAYVAAHVCEFLDAL